MLTELTATHYEILGITADATLKHVKAAYRKLALRYHPDKNKEDGANEKFKAVSAAYEMLSNNDKRKAYDEELTRQQDIDTVDIEDEVGNHDENNNNAIVAKMSFSFNDIIENNQMVQRQLVSFGAQSEASALTILNNKDHVNKLSIEELITICYQYEAAMVKFFSNDILLEKFIYERRYILFLLEKYPVLCEKLFNHPSITKFLAKLSGEQLFKIRKLCQGNPRIQQIISSDFETSNKISAYEELEKNLSGTVFDITKIDLSLAQ